jgi:HAD superfamily hydrolase (TIGR01484 family)
MRYLVLCCDYDGTIAHHGRVDDRTIEALQRLLDSGRKLVLVTGRELDDLQRVFPRLDLFERVVAENGALLFTPTNAEERVLAEAAPKAFIDALVARHVQPLSVGRAIVASWEPHENVVLDVIRDLGLELQVIFNKGAVMVLPAGVNKASGLTAALAELALSPHNAVGIGDAENDHAFLSICECSAAVANALPALKERADIVLDADHGAGVAQLIEEMIANDLADREPALRRHEIPLGMDDQGELLGLSPYSASVLIVGTSGGGKSTLASGLIERLRERGYSFCIVDPEGDYDAFESAVVIGGPDHAPTVDECLQLMTTSVQNVVINLLGVALDDRPWFFLKFFNAMRELRARTGKPHWLVVDEAHHVIPAQWRPGHEEFPEKLDGVVMISVTPALVARAVLRAIDTLLVLGDRPQEMVREFQGPDYKAAAPDLPPLEPGTAVRWRRSTPDIYTRIALEPTKTQRRRHLRKYAEGELPEDRSFYFQGPEGKLKLRAQNLITFMDLADGVDDDTWQFHLHRGDVSRWVREGIKDDELADRIAQIEREAGDPLASRRAIRKLIEATYTLPAQAAGNPSH